MPPTVHVRPIGDDEAGRRFVDYYERLSAKGLSPVILSKTLTTLESERHEVLSEWLRRNAAPDERARMAARIRVLLEQVHELGFCHRDVHVDNIVVNEGGEPLLIDPALATESDASDPCYDLVGPRESHVPVPPEHADQSGHEEGVWWDAPVTHRTLGHVLMPLSALS
jgi:streptomycin 6-kinase